MDFDFASHLDTVERSVSSLEYEGKPANAITISQSYATTNEDLWDAVTNPDRIDRWFASVSGNLELGGAYQITGNASGRITECERLSHFALTWEFGGDVSWVKVRISEGDASHTRLTLTHISHHSEQWDTFGPGAAGVGWELGLVGLAMHLARPTDPRPDETVFFTSPEGRRIIADSSEGWAQAAVAAGADPDTARAAADRTTAFYTGEQA